MITGVASEIVQVLVVAVGTVIWLIRLEGRVDAATRANVETQKDIDDLRVRHENLDTKIVEQLTQVRESLARLEGKLGTTKQE